MQGCDLLKKMNDSTQRIITKNTFSAKNDTITIIKPFILVGRIDDNDQVDAVQNRLFNVESLTYKYKKDEKAEGLLLNYCNKIYKKFFEKRLPTVSIDVPDSLRFAIKNEITSMENKIHIDTTSTINLSEKTYSILKNYPGSLYLITDVLEYYDPNSINSASAHDWIWFRVFIFDKKFKKIIFYNNAVHITYGHRNNYNSIFPYLNLKTLLNKFKKSIKTQ